jgi:ribose-phosphate pyrophosphokinase
MESIIFNLDNRDNLVDDILNLGFVLDLNLDLTKGEINKQKFSDGELCPDLTTSVRGRKVYLLTSPVTSDDVLILLLTIDAAKRASASEIIPILPYFPYARQDKKDQSRGPIGAKLFANLLEKAGASSIITIDLHADQIQGFFDIPVTHINGKDIFSSYIKTINTGNLILAGPDAGSGKRVKGFRDKMLKQYGIDLNYVMLDKTRTKANEVEKMVLIGDVLGKDVLIIDDMIDTGGTLCKAAEHLLDNGANSVQAIITHGVLSGKAYENISNSKLTKLVVSNTLNTRINPKIAVISVAEQIAKAISAFNNHWSYDSIKSA